MATGIKELAKGRSDIFQIDPHDLKVRDGWNARDLNDPDNAAHVEELALSIAEVGVKQPLTVFIDGGEIFVTNGHCRLAATMIAIERGAEIKTVPVITENRYSSEADRVLTMIVGNSGKNLTPLETAKVFKRLIDLSWTESDIATKAGLSKQRVVDLLQLHAAPDAVKHLVAAGNVSATLAGSVLKSHRGDGAAAAADLTQAVETAKGQGRTRATAKHVGETSKGLTFKQEIRDIFSRGTMVIGHENVIWSFTADDARRLAELVKQP